MPGIGPDAKTLTKVKHSFKLSYRTGMENGKSFARMGLIWSGSECLIESVRDNNLTHKLLRLRQRSIVVRPRCQMDWQLDVLPVHFSDETEELDRWHLVVCHWDLLLSEWIVRC